MVMPHRGRSSGSRSCCSTRPACTTSSGARPSSIRRLLARARPPDRRLAVARWARRRPRPGSSPTSRGAPAAWSLAIACGFLAAALVVVARRTCAQRRRSPRCSWSGEPLEAVGARCWRRSRCWRVARAALLFAAEVLAQRGVEPAQGRLAARPDRPPPRARAGLDRRASGAASWRASWSTGSTRRRLRDLVPAGAGAGGRRPAPRPRRRPRDRPADGARPAVHRAAPGPAARRSSAAGRGPSRERRFAEVRWMSAFFLDMLRGIATLKMFGRSAEQVGNIRAISRQLRRHDDGGAPDRVPDLARARVGRRGRDGPRRGRDQPAADGRRDRVRARARRPRHRPGVLPAAAPAGRALPRGSGRPGRRRAGLRDPRRAGAGRPPAARVGRRGTRPSRAAAPSAFDGVDVHLSGPDRAGPRRDST